MGLTQVSTSGIKDATVATADIADSAITAAKLASGVQTTINNNADNRVITGSGTANTLNAESGVIIDSNGRLGINNSSPDRKLEVQNDGDYAAKFSGGTGSGHTSIEIGQVATNGSAGFNATGGSMLFDIAGAEKMRLDTSGRLQIGTTVGWGSNAKLHVSDTSSNCFVVISAAADGNSVLAFSDTAATVRGALDYDHDGDFLGIKTAGSERMRIDSSGRVGINSDANGPDKLLHVSDNNAGGVVTPFRLTNVAGINGTEVRMEFECGLDEVAYISAKNEGSDTGPLTFATASSQGAYPSEKMRITKDGNVGIGTDSPAAGLHVYKVHHYVPTDSGKATGGIHVRGANGNAGEYGGAISFSCGNGDSSAAIAGSQDTADSDTNGLGFFVHESTSGSDDAIERMRLNYKGLLSCKGRAGSYVTDQKDTNHHQFINTGNGQWCMQIKQEHHNGMNTNFLVNSTSNGEAVQVYSVSNNTTRFRVLNNGDCANANNSFGSISDVKLKENIVDAKSQWDDVKAVKVRNFNFKTDKDSKMLGVVAQEVETVSSGLVFDTIDRDPNDSTKEIGTTKNVKYSVLYMKAFKALQEAMARIEVLEAKVA